jgi:group I intron endonuclease
MKKFIIYKHTNKSNGKAYIGYTSFSMEERWQQHVSDAFKNDEKSQHRVFYIAIRNYGIDNWEHEILEECKSKKEAKLAEIRLIDQYWTYYKRPHEAYGYNMTIGGDGHPEGYIVPDWVGEKISKSLSGRTLTKEHSQKISVALVGREFSDLHRKHLTQSRLGEDNSFYGKKHTEEWIQQSKELHNKPVDKLTMDNEFIKTYASLTDAYKETGAMHIAEVCNGTRRHAKHFKWRWHQKD